MENQGSTHALKWGSCGSEATPGPPMPGLQRGQDSSSQEPRCSICLAQTGWCPPLGPVRVGPWQSNHHHHLWYFPRQNPVVLARKKENGCGEGTSCRWRPLDRGTWVWSMSLGWEGDMATEQGSSVHPRAKCNAWRGCCDHGAASTCFSPPVLGTTSHTSGV